MNEDDQRTTNQGSSTPLKCDEAEDGWYSIKEVLKHKGPSNKREFLVRWEDDSETWVKAKDLIVFAKQEYYAQHKVRGRWTNRRSKN